MAVTINQNLKKPKGTGFTNIQQRMQAARPGQLGQAIGQGVSQQIGQAQTEFGKQQSEFKSGLEAGRLGTEEQRQRVSQAVQDPTKATPEAVEEFSRIRQGYKGPQGLSNQAALQGQQQQLLDIGQAARSQGGRQELLRQYVGGPQYTQGQQRLDTLLLGRAGGDLRNLRRQALQAQRGIALGSQQAGLEAEQARAQAEAFKGEVAGQLGTAAGDIESQIATEETRQETMKQAAADALERISKGGYPGEQGWAALQELEKSQPGILDTLQYGGLQELGQTGVGFLNKGAIDLAREQYASPEQIARKAALEKLAGGEKLGKLQLPGEAGKAKGFGDLVDIEQVRKGEQAVQAKLSEQAKPFEQDYRNNLQSAQIWSGQAGKFQNDAAYLAATNPRVAEVGITPQTTSQQIQQKMNELAKQAEQGGILDPNLMATLQQMKGKKLQQEEALYYENIQKQAAQKSIADRNKLLQQYGAIEYTPEEQADLGAGFSQSELDKYAARKDVGLPLRGYKFQNIRDILKSRGAIK